MTKDHAPATMLVLTKPGSATSSPILHSQELRAQKLLATNLMRFENQGSEEMLRGYACDAVETHHSGVVEHGPTIEARAKGR